jgi:hypothetical protein
LFSALVLNIKTSAVSCGHSIAPKVAALRPAEAAIRASGVQHFQGLNGGSAWLCGHFDLHAQGNGNVTFAAGDPAARQSLVDLPNDPLTLFHLQRVLDGPTNAAVDISTK